ncbi:MAG: hypothetical protein Q9218_004286 [Villophora microphyllina]
MDVDITQETAGTTLCTCPQSEYSRTPNSRNTKLARPQNFDRDLNLLDEVLSGFPRGAFNTHDVNIMSSERADRLAFSEKEIDHVYKTFSAAALADKRQRYDYQLLSFNIILSQQLSKIMQQSTDMERTQTPDAGAHSAFYTVLYILKRKARVWQSVVEHL